MIKNIKSFIWIILAASIFVGCQEEFKLSEKPLEEADAAFDVSQGEAGPNYFTFSNGSNGFIKKWDFGNGTGAEGATVTGYFPFEGEYEITLTVFNAGGSVTTSQMLTVNATDPEICNVETLQFLTGGCDAVDGKTWVIDGERKGYYGVGPFFNFFPEFYSAGPGEQDAAAFIDDELTFKLVGSEFSTNTKGSVFIRNGLQSDFPGAVQLDGNHYNAPYEDLEGLTYSLSTNETGDEFINISAPGFIGMFTGGRSYQILEINENELYIRQPDLVDGFLVWYHKFIRKGYAPLAGAFSFAADQLVVTFTDGSANADSYLWDFGDGSTSTEASPVHTYAMDGTYTVTLTVSALGQDDIVVTQEVTVAAAPPIPVAFPITWEDGDVPFGFFGGTAFNVIDNPDPSGVNTSSRVGEFVKGTEFSFAGLAVLLDDVVDFSQGNTLSMKVWSPFATNAILKIEAEGDANTFTEGNVAIPVANQWVELEFDFTGAQNNLKNLVIFMDTDNNRGGTFYIDDIKFKNKPTITLEDLVGFGSKSWSLKDGAGTWGVGPAPGDVGFFPGGDDVSGARSCIWNDEWIFNENGTMEFKTNGDFYNEGYHGLGLAEGCTSDDELVGDAAFWGSATHSFALSQGSQSTPAYLTLIGQGAHIGLAKAYNGGEYASPPPSANANITYTIYSYDPVTEELGLTIEVGTGVFWSYVLVPN